MAEEFTRHLSHGDAGRKDLLEGIKGVGTAVPETVKRSSEIPDQHVQYRKHGKNLIQTS